MNVNNKQEKINEINKFLDQLAIDKSGFLKKYNGDTNPNLIPNGFFQEYEDAMENVIKNGDDIDDRLPVTDWGKNNTVDHVGRYQTSDGKFYNVGFVEKNGKRYLLADEIGSPNYGKTTYGPREGKEVAIDYMKQTKPIIKELLDIYSIRYFGGKRIMDTKIAYSAYESNFDLQSRMEELIMIDFISKGVLNKLESEVSENRKTKLIEYIDSFVKNEITEFRRLSNYDIDKTNINMIPNFFLSGYEGSMRNTIVNKDKVYISKHLSAVDRLFDNIGKYISSDGKKYLVREANVDGKSYLCAEEEGSQNDDILAYGKRVAEDYLKTKESLNK